MRPVQDLRAVIGRRLLRSAAAIVLASVAAVPVASLTGSNVITLPPLRLAAWSGAATGSGQSLAQTVPQGAAPVATVSGGNVTVTWTGVQLSGGTPAAGYRVRRYVDGGASVVIGAGCNATVTSTSCTESAVPTGVWRYSIQAAQGTWSGPESQLGAATAVGSASLVFTSSTTVPAASLPVALAGTLSAFKNLEPISFHLDSPTGPVLTGTPASVSVTGGATMSVTIPAGTDNAPHSVFVVGALASVASAPITILDPPSLTKLEMFDGNTNGKVDRLVATFNKTLATYAAGITPWTLTGAPSGASLSSVTVSGATATLSLTEGAGVATTAVGSFTVALASNSAGIRDLNDQTVSFAATAPADKAAPALVGAPTMLDNDANGKVDRVTMTVSEPLAAYTAGTGPWALANVPSGGTLATVTTPSSTTITLTIAEGAGALDTSVGGFTVGVTADALAGVRDAAGNATTFTGVVPADGAKPIRVSQLGYDDTGNGKFDRIAVTFSEPLATYTAGKTGWTFASAPTSLTLNTVTVLGAVATLGLNEGSSFTTAVGSWTVALATNAAGIRDAAGNLSSYAAVAVGDKAAPVRTASPQLLDSILVNGKVDKVTVAMSETLAPYSAGTAPWTLTNIPSAGALASVSVATSTVTLTLTEGAGAADTTVGGMTVALSPDAVTGVRDAAGNAASFAAVAPLDKAKPVKLSQNAFDDNGNGKFDRIAVTFSEPLAAYTAGNTPWTFTLQPTGLTLANVGVTGTTATLTLNESSAVTTALGSWKMALATNAGGVRDAANNLSSIGSSAPTDKAAPVLTSLTMLDAVGGDGIVDKVTAGFSETLVATTATAPWTLTGVPSGGALTTVSTATSTVTLLLSGGVGGDTSIGSFAVAMSSNPTGVRDSAGNLGPSFAARPPVDGAGPAAIAVTTTVTGATAGRLEPGDALTVLLSEPLGPSVTLAATTTVTLTDPAGAGNDTLAIPGIWSGAQATGSDSYVTTDQTTATFDASVLTLSADRRTITVTVGATCAGTACLGLGTQAALATLSFLPDPGLRDAAGNVPTTITRTFSIKLF